MALYCGIDPGKTGAIAFLGDQDDEILLFDMPVVDGEVDAANLAELIRNAGPVASAIELVASRPKQGVRSVFSFGQSFGIALGVLGALQISVRRITPATWKRSFGLIGSDKEASRAAAIRLFPSAAPSLSRKRDDGRAEALLLAAYLRGILK